METRNHCRLFFGPQWLENSVHLTVASWERWGVQVRPFNNRAGRWHQRAPAGLAACTDAGCWCTSKVWGSPVWSESVGAVCPLAFAHFVSASCFGSFQTISNFVTVNIFYADLRSVLTTQNSDGGSRFLALRFFEIKVCTLVCRHMLLHTRQTAHSCKRDFSMRRATRPLPSAHCTAAVWRWLVSLRHACVCTFVAATEFSHFPFNSVFQGLENID